MAVVRSAMGELVDFDLIKLKQEISGSNVVKQQPKINIAEEVVVDTVIPRQIVLNPAVTVETKQKETRPDPKPVIKEEPKVELAVVEPTNEEKKVK